MRYNYRTDVERDGRRRYLEEQNRLCAEGCLTNTARYKLVLVDLTAGEDSPPVVVRTCAKHRRLYADRPGRYRVLREITLKPLPDKKNDIKRRNWRLSRMDFERDMFNAALAALDNGDEATAKDRLRDIIADFRASPSRDGAESSIVAARTDHMEHLLTLTGDELEDEIEINLSRISYDD